MNRIIFFISPYRALMKYVIAQAKHETNNFQSNVYKNNNNMFGFKSASLRPQLGEVGTPASDGGNYRRYLNDTQSLLDYIEYLKFTKFPKSVSSLTEFVDQLKSRGYFTDSKTNYFNGLSRYV